MPTVLLALGANLGDRAANLRAALQALPPPVHVTAASAVYETEPQYVAGQPLFLNMAVRSETALSPAALLAHLKAIERDLGRMPACRYGPRLIDLDILFYGQEMVETPDLVIPHPRLAERAFVLRPLADIAPDWIHPRTGRTVAEMLAALPEDAGVVLKYETLD